jgi:hypothetical protein
LGPPQATFFSRKCCCFSLSGIFFFASPAMPQDLRKQFPARQKSPETLLRRA